MLPDYFARVFGLLSASDQWDNAPIKAWASRLGETCFATNKFDARTDSGLDALSQRRKCTL